MKNLARKLIAPVVGIGLMAGATGAATVTNAGTAGATTAPSIRFVSEGYANGVFQEKVAGQGYAPGGRVWIGIAVDTWNPSTGKSSWSYQWGVFVTASQMGFNFAGGTVSATIPVTVGTFCRPSLGLAASDQTTGAYTPAAPASQYGGVIPPNQVNNTSQISARSCAIT